VGDCSFYEVYLGLEMLDPFAKFLLTDPKVLDLGKKLVCISYDGAEL
jgi:hypothetical protein